VKETVFEPPFWVEKLWTKSYVLVHVLMFAIFYR